MIFNNQNSIFNSNSKEYINQMRNNYDELNKTLKYNSSWKLIKFNN